MRGETGERKRRKFLTAAPYPIAQARFSPESGSFEAYVTSFPDANGKWLISTDGAVSVRWMPNGQVVLYERGDGTIVNVPFAPRGNK